MCTFTLLAYCIQYLEICSKLFHHENSVAPAFADLGCTKKKKSAFKMQNKWSSAFKNLAVPFLSQD